MALFALLSSALAFASPLTATAAAGDLDASFGNGGLASVPTTDRYVPVALNGPLRMPDGKLVFYGTSRPPSSSITPHGLIHRFLPDGTPDNAFGTNATLQVNDLSDISKHNLAVQSTGHLIVAANTGTTGIVRRIDTNGVADANWGSTFTGLGAQTLIQYVVTDAQDRVFVFGYHFESSPNGSQPRLVGARLSAVTGDVETTFGTDVTIAGMTAALAVAADGTPVVATNTSLTWFTSPPVTKPLSDFNTVEHIAIDHSGRVLVGGQIRIAGHNDARVQRYSGQVLDALFGTGGNFDVDFELTDSASSIAVDAADRVLVTINSSAGSPDGSKHSRVARLTTAGTLDGSFDGDGVRAVSWQGWAFDADVTLQTVFVDSAGRVVVGGGVSTLIANGASGPGLLLARFGTGGAPDPSFGANGTATAHVGIVAPVQLRVNTMATAPDATYVLTPANVYGLGLRVLRFDAQGSLDPSFGGSEGVILLADVRPFGIDVDSHGRVVLLAVAPDKGWALTRLTGTGAIDQSFGNGGLSVVTTASQRPSGFAVDALDRISIVVARTGTSAALLRYTDAGIPDTTLAPGGIVNLPGLFAFTGVTANETFAFQADGSFTVPANAYKLRRYRADGTLDPTFTQDSVVGALFTVDSMGRVITVTSSGFPSAATVARYTEAGAPDPSFTTTALPPTNLGTALPISVATDLADRVLVAYPDAQGSVGLRLYRLSSNGGTDATFANAGMAFVPSPSYWNASVLADHANRPLTVGWAPSTDDALLRRFDSGTTTPADTVDPTLVITTPVEGAVYQAGSTVVADYMCTDDVAIAGCSGTTADGSPIDTAMAGSKSFVVVGVDQSGNSTTQTVHYSVVGIAPPPPPPAPTEYQPLTPHRLLDTRIPIGVATAGRLQPGGQIDLDVLGAYGVPSNGVGAVALNITVTNTDAPGYLTVWPTGDTRPNASSLNFAAGATAANTVIAKVGAGGRVSLSNSNDGASAAVDVIADVVGWYPDSPSFTALAPKRLMDTRVPIGVETAQRLGAGSTTSLRVTRRAGIPAVGVDAVALNVTVVAPAVDGYLTVWPSDEVRPIASSVNFSAGATVANLVIAKVGADGEIKFWNSNDSATMGSIDLLVDVVGWFASGASYTAVVPTRALDTRIPLGVATAAPLAAGRTIELSTAGVAHAPQGATAVVLNLTVTGGSRAGYLTVWPSGEERPNASSINFASGQTVANLVIAKIGADGRVSIWNSNDASSIGSVHVLVDVVGWF